MTAGVPLVTISGKHDLITVPEDNRITISKLGDAVVEDVLVEDRDRNPSGNGLE